MTHRQMTVEAAIRQTGLVAILRGVPPQSVVSLAEALLAGGISVMEVALSDESDFAALEKLRPALDGRCHIGAGTVVSAEVGRRALDLGAQFFITPHVVEDVFELAHRSGVPVISGVMTPTEIAQARALGSHIVKLFPAGPLGPGYVKALKAPYPDLDLLAVGGVGLSNLADFLKAGALGAGIGGALTSQDWANPSYTQVKDTAAALVRTIQEVRGNAASVRA